MNANKKYIERREIIKIEIEILKQKLEAMDMKQKKDQDNYGYVGNCGHILQLIEELNYDFMNKY